MGENTLRYKFDLAHRRARAEFPSPGFFRFSLLVALVVSSISITRAQHGLEVRSVHIHGLRAITDSDALFAWKTQTGTPFRTPDFDSDLQLLISKLRYEGYTRARIDSVTVDTVDKSTQIALHLWLHEGERALIESIELIGDSVSGEGYRRWFAESAAGTEFSARRLESEIEQLLRFLEKEGYALAGVRIADIRYDHTGERSTVRIALRIDRGNRIRIRGLRITGNARTADNVIVREARIGENQLFEPDLPLQVKRRLERLQLFSSVSMPEVHLRPDSTVDLRVEVQEGNTNHFDGILGYVPDPRPGRKGFFTGLIDVKFRNLLGTGRRLAARWHRLDNHSQEIDLRYLEPWIASLPLDGEIHLGQRIQDSTYVRRQYGMNLSVMFSQDLSVSTSMERTEVVPAERLRHLQGEGTELFLGLSIHYDSKDDPVTPRAGALYQTSYEAGRKSVRQPDGSTARAWTDRITLDLEYYFSPVDRQVIMAALHGRDYRAPDMAAGDLFRLGGTNTLRGYRESQFLGSRLAWINLEYRLLIGGRSYVAGFVDGGYIYSPPAPRSGLSRQELTRLGYGVGVRLDSAIGLLRIGLAFGKGDSFNTAKLHFGLINEF